jgi:hypothetical protein
MEIEATATFAAAGLALYAGHHVGDYWVQTGHQATQKGDAGADGRLACLGHVLTYLATQVAFLFVTTLVTGITISVLGLMAALAVSGVTHYMADRREFGLMFWIIRRVGRQGFVDHAGVVRPGGREDRVGLASGGWALDQSWHLFWGVFVAALILAGLS